MPWASRELSKPQRSPASQEVMSKESEMQGFRGLESSFKTVNAMQLGLSKGQEMSWEVQIPTLWAPPGRDEGHQRSVPSAQTFCEGLLQRKVEQPEHAHLAWN